ncbi:MAG TPA: hypothetical protein PKC30_04500 [Saprospiraceae bacterium]|nr:hypothetical protein [Saprospiraceae bacterium]
MIQNPYNKIWLSGWMLTLSLILNVISFTGYSGCGQSIMDYATQTHLVDSCCDLSSKRIIIYSKALALIGTNAVLNDIFRNWSNYIFHYNARIEIKIITNSDLYFCTNTYNRFAQIKIIQQSSDEDSSPA